MAFGNALMEVLEMLRSLKCINRPIELGNSFILPPYNFKTRKHSKLNIVLPSVAFHEISMHNFQTLSFKDGILGILLPLDWNTKRRTRLIPSTKSSFKIRVSDFDTKRARSCIKSCILHMKILSYLSLDRKSVV